MGRRIFVFMLGLLLGFSSLLFYYKDLKIIYDSEYQIKKIEENIEKTNIEEIENDEEEKEIISF